MRACTPLNPIAASSSSNPMRISFGMRFQGCSKSSLGSACTESAVPWPSPAGCSAMKSRVRA